MVNTEGNSDVVIGTSLYSPARADELNCADTYQAPAGGDLPRHFAKSETTGIFR